MPSPKRCPSLVLIAATVLVGAGCGQGTGPSSSGMVNLRLATRAGAPLAAFVGTPDTIRVGGDELVLDTVQLVLREIEFKRNEEDACGGLDGDTHDECEELSVGPLLADLPVGVGTDHILTVAVDPGTFVELEFEVHRVGDDGNARDRDFLATHPEFRGISIRVVGTFNGRDFTYVSDLSAEQEVELSPPLVVTEAGDLDVTLMVDLATWFHAPDGSLIDPDQARGGQPFADVVRDNIRRSFRLFQDEDHDGCDDHGHNDDEGGDHSGSGLRGA